MTFVKWLAGLPFVGILVGVPFLNRVQPLILGMPLILAWIVLWIVLTAVIMTIIYNTDPANRKVAPGAAASAHQGPRPPAQARPSESPRP